MVSLLVKFAMLKFATCLLPTEFSIFATKFDSAVDERTSNNLCVLSLKFLFCEVLVYQ